MKTQILNAHDLKNEVSNWVDKFNFIQLEVLDKMSENCLFEYIRQPKPDYDEFLNSYQLTDEYQEYLTENEEEDIEETKQQFCEEQPDFERFQDDERDRNYPMWDTCFEFKHDESEEVIEAAEKAGFGIIEGLDPFNTILFVSGAGYSFYSAHWIPLYLNLPWNSELKKQVEEMGIDYSGM